MGGREREQVGKMKADFTIASDEVCEPAVCLLTLYLGETHVHLFLEMPVLSCHHGYIPAYIRYTYTCIHVKRGERKQEQEQIEAQPTKHVIHTFTSIFSAHDLPTLSLSL